MPDKKFELGDYIEVKDRIRIFYELYPGGRLVTQQVTFTMSEGDRPENVDGVARVIVSARAYRTPDDPYPGTGFSWMELPGKTPYTRGSELENAETSAWGRAIASLGILIDRSIASAQEVQNKAEGAPPAPPRPPKEVKPHDPDKSLIGKAELGKAASGVDFEVHDGQLAFRLTQGNTGYKVVAFNSLAEQVAEHRELIEGQRIKVWGNMESEAHTPKHGPAVWYSVVHLARLEVGDLTLPLPVEAETLPLPLADISEEEAAAIVAQELQEAAG